MLTITRMVLAKTSATAADNTFLAESAEFIRSVQVPLVTG
jgi:hypothetical protein